MYRAAAILAAACVGVHAFPQAVTSAIAPSASAPSGCSASYSGAFGIAVVTITDSSSAVATQSPDGQAGPGSSAPIVTQLSDGQPNKPTSAAPISQITDGQLQAATTMAPIAQISDGQIQHQTSTSSKVTMQPITQIGDGQIQATYSPVTIKSTSVSAAPVSQISDAQPQAPTDASFVTSVYASTSSVLVTPTASGAGAKRQAATSSAEPSSSASVTAVGCKSNSTLELMLDNGDLTDSEGRTGYIASNYQFQFDKPAQAGAIYTAGWSVCSNGSLALGGSAVFWQCLSGDFYNLYDRDFGAGQCTPILLQAIGLQDC